MKIIPSGKYNIFTFRVTILLFLTLGSVLLSGQEASDLTIDSVYAMSFEDLLNVKIVSASRKSEKLAESAANVEIITAEEIKIQGYHNLLDILRSEPMIDVNAAGQGYYTDIGARGVNPHANMGKYWQILIDGQDMNWYQFSRNHVSPAWVSVENIERIEIVKGPSSALWGANAYFGVINIITKPNINKNSAMASYFAGSNQTYSLNLGTNIKAGKNTTVFTSLSQYHENIPRKIKEWSLVKGSDVMSNHNQSDYLNWYTKISSGDFNINFLHSQDRSYHSIASFGIGAKDAFFPIKKTFVNATWSPSLEENTSLTFSLIYDYTTWGDKARYEDNPHSGIMVIDTGNQSSTDNFVRYMKGNDQLYGAKLLVNHKFSNWFDLTAGGDLKYVDAIRWYFPSVWNYYNLEVPEFSVFEYGIYSQAAIRPFRELTLNAGLRFDYHQIYKEVFSPRVSMVYKPKLPFVFKLIYGTAYKAPSLHELYYFSFNRVYGNPTLEPETNTTYEGQIIYRYQNIVKASVSLFYIRMNSLIVYNTRADSLPLVGAEFFPTSQLPDGSRNYRQQTNKGENTTQGIEFSVDIRPVSALEINLSGTYREPYYIEGNTKTELYYTPKFKLHTMLSYRIKNKFILSLNSRYHSKAKTEDFVRNEPGNPYIPDYDNTPYAPEFITFDFVFTVSNVTKNTELQFKVANLTNKEYYEASRHVLYHQPGVSFYGKAMLKF